MPRSSAVSNAHANADADRSPELVVVLPVYNEEQSVERVIVEWIGELQRCCENFVVLAIDDGSRDGSLDILRDLERRFSPRLTVVAQSNRGHGQTCLEGYRRGAAMGAKFLFQIDSDGQCDPRHFADLWRLRNEYPVVYGVRKQRDDGPSRRLISAALRLLLRAAFRADCPDANVPYRLMNAEAALPAVDRVPADFHLANLALAVLLARQRELPHGFVPIGFRKRFGGRSSVSPLQFGRKAVALFRQLRKMLAEGDATR